MLAIITVVAAIVSDLGIVNAVGGGSLGTIVVFVFPALMFRAAVENQHPDDIERGSLVEVNCAIALMWGGIVIGAIGVYMAIKE